MSKKLHILSIPDGIDDAESWKRLCEEIGKAFDRADIDGEPLLVNGSVETIDADELVDQLVKRTDQDRTP